MFPKITFLILAGALLSARLIHAEVSNQGKCISDAESEDTLEKFWDACQSCLKGNSSLSTSPGFNGGSLGICGNGGLSWCLAYKCKDPKCGEAFSQCKKTSDDDDPDPGSSGKPTTTVTTSKTSSSPSTNTTPSSTPAQSPQSQQQCDQAARAAATCCDHPSTCGGSQAQAPVQQSGQSMTEYCKQMDNYAQENQRANNAAGGACYQRIETCKSACNSAGDSETANGCNSLMSRVQQMGRQGLAATSSSGSSDLCKNETKAQSVGGGGGMPNMPNQDQNDNNSNSASNNPNDPTGCLTNPTGAQCQKCTANPNDPSCGTQELKGQSAFSEAAERLNTNSFDVPDVPSASRSMFDMASANSQTQPAKNGTVPNNTGGGVGGAGGGGGGAASLGGGNQRRGGGGGSGVSTDILQGNMPGGYTNAPGGNAETDGGGGWGGYGGRMPASTDGRGMDLKQFLPGQKNAPAFVGGAYSMRSAEIAGKHGDIFEKITRKFHEKCLKGQLIGCDR